MGKITPLLLCGGSGTRLWPLSRKGFPKQFSALTGEGSLFQQAATRLSGAGFGRPVVVTNSDFRFIVVEQLAAARIDPAAILIEPAGRNTAPAILAATLHIAADDPAALILVAPSDHVVPDAAAFGAAVAAATPAARAGRIVTFGIQPDRPETGYGWLELSTAPVAGQTQPLTRFVEKPDAARAEAMLSAGNFLWNAGIFLFSAETLLSAFAAHAPDLIAPVADAVELAERDLAFLRLAAAPWDKARDISIDYAVMEKAANLDVMPFSAGWSDLGDWDAVWREAAAHDAAGNATHGETVVIDCENSLLRSESEGQVLVGIGLDNMIAVAMPDAVLVAPRDRAQDVKLAVAALKSTAARQAEHFPRDHRPWGWFETLALSDRFQVKRIVVKPGAALSLQSHVHRAEHWIVVSGTARVTVGDTVKLVSENQSVFIPLGEKHRLENPGKLPMVLIEVQTGAYLGEDDIIRYEDVYARGQGAKG
ncbi:MAG: mannose-1-phosphate guanylyltransferase/mannose-6-phosphate isomerase [Pseudorhodobacter sp.]|nr:MAG: mannose-1-phosphate guanylyltransferase/mannose-6-phosphate isomerase [Pseudorhodobacter sp.]